MARRRLNDLGSCSRLLAPRYYQAANNAALGPGASPAYGPPMAEPAPVTPFPGGDKGAGRPPGKPSLHALPTLSAAGAADARRALPSSLDAEKGVLASMLLDPNDALNTAMAAITSAAFHFPAHRLLFDLLIEFKNKNRPIEAVSLLQTLIDRGQVEEIGGAATLSELLNFVPVAAHIEYYIDLVREKFVLREVIGVCTRTIQRAYQDQENVPALLDDAERDVLAIRDTHQSGRKAKEIGDHVRDAVVLIEKMMENPGLLNGIPTGYTEFDEMTRGLHGSEMVIIAARPSMGKTSLVMNIVEHVAVDRGVPCAVFSLEMSAEQLVQRLLCSRAHVSMANLHNGFIQNDRFMHLTHVASEIASAPIHIDDTPSLSIGEFRAKARRLRQRHGIGLIAVDYLQLMRSTTRRAQDNRQIEIAEISSGLKAAAKELNIPVIVLAQLNRSPESRTGDSRGRPRLSDLRESGSIEQDADVVGLLVRPEYYAESEEEKTETEGEVELIIAKQRNGPTGTVRLTFLKEFMRFENRLPEHAAPH